MPARHDELAHAKLTRTLRVEGRRDDGYHLLRAEMVSLDLCDEIEFGDGDGLEVLDEVTWAARDGGRRGEPVPAGEENLVHRALALVGRRAAVRLTKHIPHGAGLGGGSADAAAVLRWAGRYEPSLAVRLGADVPFCVREGRAIVTGIGEVVTPLEEEPLAFLLCTPDIAVSTAAVYAAFDELGVGDRVLAHNDLERAALAVAPGLSRARDVLFEVAGRRPQLGGSGSTFFVECDPAEVDALASALARATVEAGVAACVTAARATGAAMTD